MLKKGLVQVYTADTNMFNFAPIGLSLRAAGQGLRSLIACLVPQEPMNSASTASALLKSNLIIDNSAIKGTPPHTKPPSNKIIDSFKHAREAVIRGDFDIVILDGIHSILDKGIITLEDLLALMEEKSSSAELILTGPGAHEEIIKRADLVTRMAVSHSKKGSVEKDRSQGPGTIEVITGDGKGKTTYCLGRAMLASCSGIRSTILQFIKSPQAYGEVKAIRDFPLLTIRTMGKGFIYSNNPEDNRKHLDAVQNAWEISVKEILSKKYGLIVLDEINIAVHYGFIRVKQIKDLIDRKPEKLTILLSGRNAPPRLTELAATTIQMQEIKHPFTRGIKARKGIEF